MATWPNDSGFDTEYEQHTPVELTVKGKIPPYAAGILYRTGPLGYKIETNKRTTWAANHWFDGLSAVHRFQIDCPDGTPESVRVTYRSRRIVDKLIQHVKESGRLEKITFAAKRDPCKSLFQKVMSTFLPQEQPPNIGVTLSVNLPGLTPVDPQKAAVNGHSAGIQTLYSKTDSTPMCKIDPETLEPEGVVVQTKFHPDLKGPLSAAHGRTDPQTGDFYNFNLELGLSSGTYRVFQVSKSTGKTTILATFAAAATYLHSFFLTESYVVLCVWGSHFTAGGMPILYHKNIAEAIAPFNASKPATFYVVDRKHGKGLVATYESDTFFCFHTVNAWEEPSSTDPGKTDIMTELSMYDNLDVVHRFYYDNLVSSLEGHKAWVGEKRTHTQPYFGRFKLGSIESASSKNPARAELVWAADRNISGELPTLNPSYLTKPHRYTYGVADRSKSAFFDGILKFDSSTRTAIFWETEGHTPGEPIFVADPNGVNEDDGVLLSVVLDGFKERSYLLVLNAKDLTELGRAEVGGPVSFGFHGTHVPEGRVYAGDV